MKILKLILILLVFFFVFIPKSHAQTTSSDTQQQYYRAKVLDILKQGEHPLEEFKNPYQILKIQFLDGPQKGQIVTLQSGVDTSISEQNLVKKGDNIIVTNSNNLKSSEKFVVYDKYRLDKII